MYVAMRVYGWPSMQAPNHLLGLWVGARLCCNEKGSGHCVCTAGWLAPFGMMRHNINHHLSHEIYRDYFDNLSPDQGSRRQPPRNAHARTRPSLHLHASGLLCRAVPACYLCWVVCVRGHVCCMHVCHTWR